VLRLLCSEQVGVMTDGFSSWDWTRVRLPRRRWSIGPSLQIQMRALVVIIVFVLLLLAPRHPAHAQEGAAGFRAFVASLWPEARSKGVSRATFEAAFEGMQPDPAVWEKSQHQAEYVKPIADYLSAMVSPTRIAKGRVELDRLGETVSRLSREYGVDPYVLLAVWGMESNFGENCGSTSVIRDLATLAYDGYRPTYFRHELIVALQIAQQNRMSPAAMRGSWAGAMGQTQFMPSSFVRYAVAYDKSARKDIWGNARDALASTANYLARHGWVRGWTWGYEVLPPSGATGRQGATRDFSNWAASGWRRADGGSMPTIGRASLLLPAGADGPAFLTTKNFAVIRTYNNAVAYALGVSLLSDRIAGAGPVKSAWPAGDIPTASLTR
jgi:membrane-bound lytic murein transglycosylase B